MLSAPSSRLVSSTRLAVAPPGSPLNAFSLVQVDFEPVCRGEQANAAVELLGADLEGLGELEYRAKPGLASAPLEQGDLGPVEAGEEAQLFLGQLPCRSGVS